MTTIARAEARLVPYRLEAPVGGSGVSAVDLIVVELVDSDGAQGLGFSYVIGGAGSEVVLAAARAQLQAHVAGTPIVPPPALWRRIEAGFNRSGAGPNLLALAAIDVAAWDLDARRRGVPLGVAFGGHPRPTAVYGSGGFYARQSPQQAAEQALRHLERGFTAVKPRVGGSARDLEILDAVCAAVGSRAHVMADANEKCDMPSARRLLAAARDRGLLFVEEPLPASQVEGYRALAAAGGAAVATGEHLQTRSSFVPFIADRLVSVIQPDLAMAGGLTPILQVTALAELFGVAVAPHFLPGLFVHLAAVSPAVTWLEEFPLVEPLFDGWPETTRDGMMTPREAPGHGLSLSEPR
jgi:L-alanine-DL-glutamate epimerase-like enolase superfamily enzyme